MKTLILALAPVVMSAATPITATFTTKAYHYNTDGSLALLREDRGSFAVSSSGDEVTATPNQSFLKLKASGTSYYLRHTSQQYAKSPWPSQAQDMAGVLTSQELAKGATGQVVNGVFCVPVPMHNTDGAVTGRMWSPRITALPSRKKTMST